MIEIAEQVSNSVKFDTFQDNLVAFHRVSSI